MIVNTPFIFEVDESKFKEIFVSEFLNVKICYKHIPVIFTIKDFDHICYEKGKEGVEKEKFGLRRARRLLVLKYMLLEKIPSELRFESKSGNYCLLCEELDFVAFLYPNPKDKVLNIGTIIHFGDGFTKAIEKNKNNSIPVDTIIFREG